MYLTSLLTILVLGVAWIPTASADADFHQVKRWHPVNHNWHNPDQPNKYFHEATFSAHYDGRFAATLLPYEERPGVLKHLVQAYLATFLKLGVQTWLMHGSLLGWWWGQKILPWDTDIDVQVTEASMYFLAAYYNMTTYFHHGREYLLEINPNYVNREQTDTYNVIDARWIDMYSGMFIDITTVRYNMTHPEGQGVLSCKDGHEFRDTYLYPLHRTTFEGVTVNIPFKYEEMLEAEYGSQALYNKVYHNHVFNETRMEWMPRYADGGDGPSEL